MGDRNARAARIAVGTIFLANGAAFGTWASRIPAIKADLGLDEAELGLALLAAGIGALMSMPLAGAAAARLGSAVTTRALGVACVASLALLPVPASLATLGAALLLFGALNGALDVCMNVQGVVVERRYGRPILAGMHALWSLGGLAGAGLGALAAPHLAPGAHLGAAAVLLTLTMAAAGARLLPDPGSPAGDAVFARPSRRLAGIALVVFCGLFAEGAVGDWSAVYLHDDLGAGARSAALGYAAFSATMVIGRLFGDRVTLRLGPRVVLGGGLGLAGVGLGLAVLVDQVPVAILGFTLMGLGLAAVVPVAFRAASEAPGVSSGAGVAGVSTVGYLGFLIGPPVIGAIGRGAGLAVGLGLVAGLLLLAAPLAAGSTRRAAPASA